MMMADVANTFCMALSQEKVWAKYSPEFGNRCRQHMIIQCIIYRMAFASRSFHNFLADALIELDFKLSRADPNLWIKENTNHDGYIYIATRVDNLICISKKPEWYIAIIEQHFLLWNQLHNPNVYLGIDLKVRPNGNIHISSQTYIIEALQKYELKHSCLKKEKTQISYNIHSKMDKSKLLDETKHL